MPEAPPTVPLLGYRVAALSLEAASAWLLQAAAESGPPRLIVTLNPEIVVQAEESPELREALAGADLTVADGVGLLWAARRRGARLPERVPGVDLTARALELAGPGLSVFFLGARDGVARRAAEAAAARWGTRAAGWHHGYFRGPEQTEQVIAMVRASGAQLLLAGLGEGQELFLHRHRARLGVRVLMGVGGTLDVLAGEARRTPAWTRRLGVEWAWRVGLDRRRWHRFPRLARFVRLVLESDR